LVPASDGGDDLIGVGGPDEWFGAVIGLGEEAFDGGLEVDVRAKYAAFQPSPSQFGEEALDSIEPGWRFRRIVEGEARMAIELVMRI